MRSLRPISLLASCTLLFGLLAGCGGSAAASSGTASPRVTTYALQSSKSYTPKAPPGGGTDDYHCTLVDPHVKSDAYITSSQFFPESPEVHHAILFLVPPNLAAQARAADVNGQGWTCFGESALPHTAINIPFNAKTTSFASSAISNTPWLSAWAPGRGLDVVPKGTGVQFPEGSLVVMQIHYNMLVGDKPVRSKLVLNTVPAASHLQPLDLNLLPAAPDLPCPAGVTGPLCSRNASLTDLGQRFGEGQVGFVNLIERICGRNPADPPGGVTTTCTWPVRSGQIIRLTAHMHLLGRGMKIVLDAGTPKQQTLLNVTNYNFDYQRSYNLAQPVRVSPGDSLQVTCTYDPTLRQKLPQLRRLPPRYVTWGDGSSDEMCLAIVQSIA